MHSKSSCHQRHWWTGGLCHIIKSAYYTVVCIHDDSFSTVHGSIYIVPPNIERCRKKIALTSMLSLVSSERRMVRNEARETLPLTSSSFKEIRLHYGVINLREVDCIGKKKIPRMRKGTPSPLPTLSDRSISILGKIWRK